MIKFVFLVPVGLRHPPSTNETKYRCLRWCWYILRQLFVRNALLRQFGFAQASSLMNGTKDYRLFWASSRSSPFCFSLAPIYSFCNSCRYCFVEFISIFPSCLYFIKDKGLYCLISVRFLLCATTALQLDFTLLDACVFNKLWAVLNLTYEQTDN